LQFGCSFTIMTSTQIGPVRPLAVPTAQVDASSWQSFRLLWQLAGLALLFVAELLLITVLLDNAAIQSKAGLLGLVGTWGAWTIRGVVGFAAVFVTFAILRYRPLISALSADIKARQVNVYLLGAHAIAMAAFGWLSWICYGGRADVTVTSILAPLWLLASVAGFLLAAFAFIPPAIWLRFITGTGALGIYASIAVMLACVVGNYSRELWAPSAQLTFALVKTMLGWFSSNVISVPATSTLGTARFSVQIAPECSGFEGAGLILAFVLLWLGLFREECRFPHALILIPVGVSAIYLLNAVRLTALILIGDAGAERIALGGFHSQAGWISFNLVALGICIAARRVPWINARPVTTVQASSNPTAAYLLPFLAIIATGMLTNAASAELEWLYPVRMVAALVVLWIFRHAYRGLHWNFSWFGPAIGVAVFLLWIGIDLLMNPHPSDAMPRELAAAAFSTRAIWLCLRAAGAIITVPIAEELAFRGFLLRRMQAEDFEAVPLTSYTWLGLAVSSVAFGFLHGSLWFAGILCGLLYAWAQLRRGRLGEAVAAHATTNALLAAYVLTTQKWHLW
jgi:exosortase E/protease (VPEID-CTERM system)